MRKLDSVRGIPAGVVTVDRLEAVGSSPDPTLNVVRRTFDQSPEGVWYGVEDLLLRIHGEVPLKAKREGGNWRLTIPHSQSLIAGELSDLYTAALDPQTYRWRIGGDSGSFLSWASRDDANLVLSFTPLHAIDGWPGGRELAWQVESLFVRMRAKLSEREHCRR